MKKIYKKPTITLCDLQDEDIVATSGNIESGEGGGEETPDESHSSPFRNGIWSLLPLLMLSLFSCSSSDEQLEEGPTGLETQNDKVTLTIHAAMDGDGDNAAGTRVVLHSIDSNNIYHFRWQKGDKINVLYKEQDDNEPFNLKGDDLVQGVFTGNISLAAKECISISPYQREATLNKNVHNVILPTVQQATPGSFDRYAGLLMGKATKESGKDEIDMFFKHVCSFIELKPTEDYDKIIVSTRSHDEYLAGNLYLNYDTEQKVPLLVTPPDQRTYDLVNKVTLQGPITKDNTYYIAVLPGTYEHGIRITCFKDGKSITKQKSSAVTLNRGSFKGYTAFLATPSVEEQGIDLGTSILWASNNLGATSPREMGDMFAWGDMMPLYSYQTDEDYGAKYKLAPTESTYKKPDSDPSSTYMGDGWRMPTKAEVDELLDQEKFTWSYDNTKGAEGYIVSSKANNSQLFFPIRNGDSSYWTSTHDNNNASNLRLNPDAQVPFGVQSDVRYKCFYIRPVKDKPSSNQ